MKFLKLTFEAFGSYPGEEVVDFTSLTAKGLFVVTGPTGTGKTTIFDAMVYALYGTLPGERSKDADPRSQHADPSTLTRVTLDFEVAGRRYRVERTPTQDRPVKRGEGYTSQAAKASLHEIVNGKEEPVASGATAVEKRCAELVGLDAKQFQRVVLLPQGKFTEFLIANDEERQKLLSQLFDGDLYDRVIEDLRQRERQLSEEVGSVEETIRHHQTNARDAINAVRAKWTAELSLDESSTDLDVEIDQPDFHERMSEAIAAARPVLERHLLDLEKAKNAATEADRALQALRAATERFVKKRDARERLQALEAQATQVMTDHAAATHSVNARPVVAAHRAHLDAQQRLTDAGRTADELAEVLRAELNELGIPDDLATPADVAVRLEKVRSDLDTQRQQLRAHAEAVKNARSAADKMQSAHNALAAIGQELTALDEQLGELSREREAVAPLAATLEDKRREAATAGDAVAGRRSADDAGADADRQNLKAKQLSDTYHDLMSRFIGSAAPRLAEQLQPGAACPVCGSTEHPSPAVQDAGDKVDQTEVDAARERLDAAQSALTDAQAKLAAARSALGAHADTPLTDLEAWHDAAKASLALAQNATATVADLDTRHADITSQRHLADQRRQKLSEESASTEREFEIRQNEADRLAAVVAPLDADLIDARHEVLIVALEHATRFDELHRDHMTLAGSEAQAAARLEEMLAQSEFADLGAAIAALLDVDAERTAISTHERWSNHLLAARTTLGDLADAPDTEPSTADAEENLRIAQEHLDDANQATSLMQRHLETAEQSLQAALDTAAGAEQLLHDFRVAQVVYNTCNGKAALGVKLPRWILGGELARVAVAANVHLARMTRQRYQLRRPILDKKGLGLEVVDASTGQARGTNTLSGGEQFQASLALALGLADVISMGGAANGKRFDALFIDEGFGSLDAAALDESINTLRQLHAAGRMVGAITHVEAMKTELPVGIEVSRRSDGKGSTLRVNP